MRGAMAAAPDASARPRNAGSWTMFGVDAIFTPDESGVSDQGSAGD
jgi:hypothetical protein